MPLACIFHDNRLSHVSCFGEKCDASRRIQSQARSRRRPGGCTLAYACSALTWSFRRVGRAVSSPRSSALALGLLSCIINSWP
jgi:hypothetical protein